MTSAVTVDVYDTDGVTHRGTLANARAAKWIEELSKPGSASFEVPLADAALIADRMVVKFSLSGAVRFACRIQSEAVQLAVDGRQWLRFDTQPEAGWSMLAEGVVYQEEYGPRRASTATRSFGWMSRIGPWYVTADWNAPTTDTVWGDMSSRHKNRPPDFKTADPSAAWISSGSPDTTVPVGTTYYFRRDFTLSAITDVNILCSGDDFLEMYVDGDQQIAADTTLARGWWVAQAVPLRLAAGAHLIAVKVANAALISAGHSNPVGFIATVQEMDGAGNPTGTILLRTSTGGGWLVNDGDPEPGWFAAEVLTTLVGEAQARAVAAGATGGCRGITLGFTDTADTDSVAWTVRDQFAFDISTIGLGDVATQLVEAGHLDVGFDYTSAPVFNAWVRRGQDRSGTVSLTFGAAGGNLKAFEVASHAARFTTVLSQLSDGSWVETTDTAATGVAGRIESGLALGSTSSPATAARIAQALLAESSSPLVTVTAEPSTLAAPVAYVDYFLGDTITIPGRRGVGTMKARVMSISVDASGETVRSWPELVLDPSS